MDNGFSGATVVVTGAGSGIGRATALRFASLGAKVHAADLNGDSVRAVREEIEGRGGTAVDHQVDSSDPAAVADFAERVFAADGAVDVLHNNAGIGHAGAVDETSVEDWQKVIGVNLLGVAYGVQAFVPRMLSQGRRAAVVNTASGLGLIPVGEMAPYCTSKFGVVGMSQSLHAELAPRGIRVSAVCPGIIDTPITTSTLLGSGLRERQSSVVDFYRKRGASPDEVAEAVVGVVRRHRLVVTVPRWHVVPGWVLHRLSIHAAQPIARRMVKLMSGG